MVDIGVFLRLHGKEGPSGDGHGTELAAALNDLAHRLLLYGHGADKDIVGPADIIIGQAGYVHINQLFLPFPGQHGGNRQQSQRGVAALFGYESQGVLEAPEGYRKLGIYH